MTSSEFSLGKIKSKHLIIGVLSYSHFLTDGSKLLFDLSKSMRRMLIENYYVTLNVLIPEESSIKTFLLEKRTLNQTQLARFVVYNLQLNSSSDLYSFKRSYEATNRVPLIRKLTIMNAR